jgi:BolA family transcriptional regulator, general stress-responsive regulator
MDNIDRELTIRHLLEEAFQPEKLNIIDESHKHIGHANFGGGHFKVQIVSGRFTGLSRLEIHRQIFDVLNELMEIDIHALAIEASAI